MQATTPVVGEHAPDATLAAADGRSIRLATLWLEGPLVLVFLRHPGCPFCREMLARLRGAEEELARRGATIAVVLPTAVAGAQSVCAQLAPHFVCLADPDGRAYELYGLGRASWLGIAGPEVMMAGVRTVLTGHLPGLPRGDTWRLGGAFVIGQDGRVRFVHRGRHAADNPSPRRLLMALDGVGAVKPREAE